MFFEFALVTLLALMVTPWLAAAYADSIGRSYWFWFWMGLLFPLVSNLVLICLPKKLPDTKKGAEPGLSEKTQEGTERKGALTEQEAP